MDRLLHTVLCEVQPALGTVEDWPPSSAHALMAPNARKEPLQKEGRPACQPEAEDQQGVLETAMKNPGSFLPLLS